MLEHTNTSLRTKVDTQQTQPPAVGSPTHSHLPAHEVPSRVATSSGTSDLEQRDLTTVPKRLHDSFEPSRARTSCDSDEFLPRNALRDILTDKTIQSLLMQTPETSLVKVDNITGHKKRVKIFAILLLIKETKHIWPFIERGISDDNLPLCRDCLKTCLRSDNHVASFVMNQCIVDVPVWNFAAQNVQEERYGQLQKLPFLTRTRLSSGGQGVVWKVQIHPDHYETSTGLDHWERLQEGPFFALKEFGRATDFRDELKALKHFTHPHTGHENLIKALAAYSKCEKYFLLFPLAEGNLESLWQQAGPSLQNSLWLLKQCYGLVQGLQCIHQYQCTDSSSGYKRLLGRHGDIKPQNILWFRDPSTTEDRLVLSDFTLMRFHAEGSNTETTMKSIGGTRTYRAPEVAVTFGKHVSQGYDVWSLGCVFLEFISCHLVGYDATRGQHFEDGDGRDHLSFYITRRDEDICKSGYYEDKFFLYNPGMKEAEVKESVKLWFSYLRGLKHCPSDLHHFLDIIQGHMLVIKPESRWSIQELVESLAKILDQSHQPDHGTGDCYYNRESQDTSLTGQFPPLCNGDGYHQHIRQHWSTHISTHCDLNSSAHLGRTSIFRDSKDLTCALLPGHDITDKLGNDSADYMFPPRTPGPVQLQHTRSTTIVAGSTTPKDDDIFQKNQSPGNDSPETPETAVVIGPRQEHPLRQKSMCVTDQELSPMTGPLRVIDNISASQTPGSTSTPASSHPPSSTSRAHSTYSEKLRPSMSSRTDESMLNSEGCSQSSQSSEAFHCFAIKELLEPEMPAYSLPTSDTTLRSATRMETSPGPWATKTRSVRKHGVNIWQKLKSLKRRGVRSILNRGRRIVGPGGREGR